MGLRLSSFAFLSRKWVVLPVLFLAVLAVYGNTLRIPFDSDTKFLTVQNAFVISPSGIFKIWSSEFFGGAISKSGLAQVSGYYRPVTNSLFWLEYRVFGGNEWAYHLTQIAIHFTNSFLLYLICLRLSGDPAVSFLSAILFAVHPIHAQEVSHVAARSDVLFLLFYALAMYLYSSGTLSQNPRWRRISLVLTTVSYLLSILSKEMGSTLPVELALLHLYFYYRFGIPLRSVVRTLPLWGAFAAYLFIRLGVLGIWPQELGYHQEYPVAVVYLNLVKNYLIYLLRILFPHGAEYPELFPTLVNVIDPTLRDPLIWDALLLVLGLLLLSVRCRNTEPLVSFSILFFLVTVFPLMGVNHISGTLSLNQILAQERWIYLPSMGVFIALGWVLAAGLRRAGEAGPVAVLSAGTVAVALLAGLGWMTSVHGPATLSHLAVLRRYVLFDEGRLSRMDLANKRILTASLVSLPLGRTGDAIAECEEAKQLVPDSPIPALALAEALGREHQWDRVIAELEPWLRVDLARLTELQRTNFRVPDDVQRTSDGVALLLGRAYSEVGQGKKGAEMYCLSLRRSADPKAVRKGLFTDYALNGPAHCMKAPRRKSCIQHQTPPPFPEWSLPLDPHTCPAWADRFEK